MTPEQQAETLSRAIQLCDGNNLEAGEALCEQVLGQAPGLAVAQHLMGLIQFRLGRELRALSYFSRAVSLNPAYVQGHYDLGVAQKARGNMAAAAESFSRAVALDPGHADALNNLGNVKKLLGDLTAAAELYERAVAARPDFADALHNLGNACRQLGRVDDAVAFFRRTLAINPDDAEAHYNLSLAVKHTEYDAEIRAMQAQLSRDDIPDDARTNLLFGLGKALEDISRFDDAFRHFREGNRLVRTIIPYHPSDDRNYFQRIKAVFTPALFQAFNGAGNSSKKPIFIIGMPRSGTSLAEQILASHSRVFGAGELPDLTDVATLLCASKGNAKFPECIENLNAQQLGSLGAQYLTRLEARNADTDKITDKMPHNFILVGLIRLILPNAKIIHCVRDPMDTCLSIFKTHFSSAHAYAYDLADLGKYYGLYLDLMAHWQAVLPGVIYPLIYENLIADQEGETRRLLSYCDLEWDAACLTFHRTRREVMTASASQVRRPIYADSVKLWKHYQHQLEPLKQALEKR